MTALRYVRDDSDLRVQRSVGVRGHYGSLGCARLLGEQSLLVSYMPLAHCGRKFFHGLARGYRARELTRSILVTSSHSLNPREPTRAARVVMPRPTGAPLVVACYAGRVADVRALLASGADPRAPSAEGDTPIFSCIHFGYANILEKLLATGQYDLVHQVQTSFNPCYVPPLFYLLYYWAKPDRPQLKWPGSDPLECVRLLIGEIRGDCGEDARQSRGWNADGTQGKKGE